MKLNNVSYLCRLAWHSSNACNGCVSILINKVNSNENCNFIMKRAYSQDYLRKSYSDHKALWESVLCCLAVPDDEKFKQHDHISSHHEQQLGYHHQIHDVKRREHQLPQSHRQQSENYTPTQVYSQTNNEQQESRPRDQLKQPSTQNSKQHRHYYRQDSSDHQPRQHHLPQHQQSSQRKQLHRQLPPSSPSPHRRTPPSTPSLHLRRNRPRQSPDRNLDNAQETKAFLTIADNGKPLRNGESDSFERNDSRPISVEDIFQRLPLRYEDNYKFNLKSYNNDGRSLHQEPYIHVDSEEKTSEEILDIPVEKHSKADHHYQEPYFFEGNYQDESLAREESVSVYAYTEGSVQSVSLSTERTLDAPLFVDNKTKRFKSNQPEIMPNVGFAHLRRQLEDLARKQNTSSVRGVEDTGVTDEKKNYDLKNDRSEEDENRGEDEPIPVYHHKTKFDEYTEVYGQIPNITEKGESSETSRADSGFTIDTSHPDSLSEFEEGLPTSLSVSSVDLGRRSRFRHQSSRRRFQRPQQGGISSDQRARNMKPHISMRKQLARYSDTHSIVSPLFNSTFSRENLFPSNSDDLAYIDLTKSQSTIKTRPSFHINPDAVLDFASDDDTKGNPSSRIVDEIVEYSQSSEGQSDLKQGFDGPDNPPVRKYSYSYVNHYIAPTPKVTRTTEKPNFAPDKDVRTFPPKTHVDEAVISLPPQASVYHLPNATLKDTVVGEYSDSFPIIIKDSVFVGETTRVQTEPTTTVFVSTTPTTTTPIPITTTTTYTTTPSPSSISKPEVTTSPPITTTVSAASISTEQSNPFSRLVNRASGNIIVSTESSDVNIILTSPLSTPDSLATTTPATPSFVVPENFLKTLPPSPYPNLTGLASNFSTTNWNPASGIQTDLKVQNPFSFNFPTSQSFQSNAQSQSSPLGSSGSGLFGLGNLLGLGTLSGLQGFGQSSSVQPGAANLGLTSGQTSHLGSVANSNSGQQGGNVPDLGSLGYLSLLAGGLGGLNLSPQSGLDFSNLPSQRSAAGQQSQSFSNPFQQATQRSGSGQPDNSLLQLFLKQLGGGGGGGSPGLQNPLGFASSVGQNPYAIHPQALTLGAASAPSLLPASFGAGSVQPAVAAPIVAPAAAVVPAAAPVAPAASSNSGSNGVSIASAVPEGT